MKSISTLCLTIALGVGVPSFTFAQAADPKNMDMKSVDMKGMGMEKNAPATTHMGTGVVKNINLSDGVVTLVHEPIKSLNWPTMTMGFQVKDKVLLDKVKPGHKVEFTLVQAGKDYVITSMK